MDGVRQLRGEWAVTDDKKLWFRAENKNYESTKLRPRLYRPPKGKPDKLVSELLTLDNALYEEFERCAAQLCDVRPGEDWEWEWYFLMQHHGVPTRLLDWTDGALIALHFAVRYKSPGADNPLVFVLDPYWLNNEILKPHSDRADAKARWHSYCQRNPSQDGDDWDRLYLPADEEDAEEPLLETPKIPLLWDSPHITRRVAAQRSRFMVFGTEPSWIAGLAERSDSRVSAIAVQADSISQIRRELRDAGVTESVIYPDLDGLGRELDQVWRDRF
jgi:hypothetical protein